MNENKASFTAISTACKRAYHSMHDSPKIFDDFLAYRLIPEDMRVRIEQHLTDKQLNDPERAEPCSDQTMPSLSLMKATIVLSRARYTEDMLEKAVRQGVKQYAILEASAYDPNVKSFFSWLGVTAYLTREEIFATLNSITKIAPVSSAVIFDYLDNDTFISEKSYPEMQKRLEFLRKMGEPMIIGFNPPTLAEDLANLGFRLNENLSPADIERRYFQGRTDGYHAQEYEYIAYATVE